MDAVGDGRPIWLLRSGVTFVAFAVALAASEVFLRIFLPQPLGVSYRAPNGLTLHIPGASIRFRRLEFDNVVRINSLGLRDREISIEKPPGVFRILVLGDSFTEGKQVADEETFPKLLESALAGRLPNRRWEVINGGVSGYGTADEIKFFEVLGRRFQPDVVVLAFCMGNDVHNNLESPHFRWDGSRLEERPLKPPQRLELRLARVQEFFASRSHLYQFVRDRLQRTIAATPDPLEEMPVIQPLGTTKIDDDSWQLTEALLDRLLALVDREGSRLLLTLIPQRVQVLDEEWKASTGLAPGDPMRIEPQLRLIAYARRHLLPFLDLMPYLHDASTQERTYFRIDGHFNVLGHRISADAILESLVNFRLLGETP